MKFELLIGKLKNIFEQNNERIDHFSWLIQGEFGVDFDLFLHDLLAQLFGLSDLKHSSKVLCIEGENGIKIDEIRSINNFLKNKSQQWRIIIIKNLHQMNPSAANALLKILEEPPKNTIFVCTTVLELLLTIISRMNVFFLSIEQKNQENYDEIMKIAGGSNVIIEKIIEFGGLESIELMQNIIFENNNQDTMIRLMEIVDFSKHFEIICYLILHFLREKLFLCEDFFSKKKVVYEYEKIVELMAKIGELNCNKKAFLFSFLK